MSEEVGTGAEAGESCGQIFDTTNKVLFSIVALVIGFFLYIRIKAIIDSMKVDSWPPEIDECPNMWVKVGPKKSKNVLGIGKKSCPKTVNFNDAQFVDARSKCRWAKYTCNVDWDGYDKLC